MRKCHIIKYLDIVQGANFYISKRLHSPLNFKLQKK
jgi:hypothetical protein